MIAKFESRIQHLTKFFFVDLYRRKHRHQISLNLLRLLDLSRRCPLFGLIELGLQVFVKFGVSLNTHEVAVLTGGYLGAIVEHSARFVTFVLRPRLADVHHLYVRFQEVHAHLGHYAV